MYLPRTARVAKRYHPRVARRVAETLNTTEAPLKGPKLVRMIVVPGSSEPFIASLGYLESGAHRPEPPPVMEFSAYHRNSTLDSGTN